MKYQHTLRLGLYLSVLTLTPGCMKSYYPSNTNQLSKLPAHAHQNEVEVYMPGEKPADSAYVKMRILEITGGDGLSYAAMVNAAKRKAQQYGLDAVLVLGKDQQVEVDNNITLLGTVADVVTGTYTPPVQTVYTYQVLSAVGIKYLKNMDYLSQYIKVKHVYRLSDSVGQQYAPVCEVSMGFDGSSKDPENSSVQGMELYRRYVKKYDLYRIVKEQSPQWNYHCDDMKRLVQRNYKVDGIVRMKYKFHYTNRNEIYRIDCTPADGVTGEKREKIILSYVPGTSLVREKSVFENNILVCKEVFNYNENQQLTHSVWLRADGAVPFLKINYEYYQQEDIEKLAVKKN